MTHISTPADVRPSSDRFRCGGRGSNFLLVVILTLSLGLFVFTARAEVKPYALCTDGMVLQQQTEAKLWGTAETGEVVTVTFRGKQASATAGEAGGPFEMTIVGKNTLSYKNVLVGEVWLCSGQSNMDWGLNNCDESDKAYANTAPSNAMLRLFTTFAHNEGATTHGPAGVWVEANAKTIYGFSGVGYFFGRSLQEHRKVPVGLIHASVGATRIEQWMSPSAVAPFEKPKPDAKPEYNAPSFFYKGIIQPLLDYRLRGVIWYQGESNSGDDAIRYRDLLPTMINSWRTEFQNPELAFHIVELPPIGNGPAQPTVDGVPVVREAQTLTALMLKNTGLAVITDFGGSIHPNPKRPVGERLALAARGITYGEKIVYSGPMLKSLTFDGAKAILSFAHVGGGLVAKEMVLTAKADGSGDAYRVKEGSTGNIPLVSFSLCGKDKVYQPAQAEIVGDTVVVTSGSVAAPSAVCYGFSRYPVCNLYNREGLPASPFRTDQICASLKLFAGAGGKVSPINALLATKGMAIPIRAMPAPNHVFTGWTVVNGAAEVADPKAGETTVRVTDDSALRASFSFVVSCAITAPANPTLVKAGSKLKLVATASILQGNSKIRKVEFFRDDVKIGEAAANPYACTWSDVPAGTHTVTARVTDSGGLVATSVPVCVVATASGSWEGIHATGGTVAYYTEGGKNWTAHVFTNSGVLDVKAAGEVEYLLVGGGGGGGGFYDGAGGGGGGFLTGRMMLSNRVYAVTVGRGGGGHGSTGGKTNGGDSVVSCEGADVVRASGGGYGGSSSPAGNGGSGGGGAHGAPKGIGVAGPPRQGYDGGAAGMDAGGAGGGGAGGVGQNASPAAVRDGGLGRASTLRDGATAVTYSAGGVGRTRPRDVPVVDGQSKADNTGDGGDGGSSGNSSAKGGTGGSGIVIIRYVTGGK
ncbi:MAG: sialate O-acetylesterase [Verrucomicrobiota bacterium]